MPIFITFLSFNELDDLDVAALEHPPRTDTAINNENKAENFFTTILPSSKIIIYNNLENIKTPQIGELK